MPKLPASENWRIDGLFDDEVSVSILNQEGETVAEIEPFTESWTPTEIARVHVIAAAPELLQSLHQLWAAVVFHGLQEPGTFECERAFEVLMRQIDTTRKLIAWVEGDEVGTPKPSDMALIFAAPDLLAALRCYVDLFGMANAAIAKAEGR